MSVLADMSLSELKDMVEQYPWFSAARMELAVRLSSLNSGDGSELFAASLYAADRKKLRFRCISADTSFKDPDLAGKIGQKPKIVVVGGDYFTSDDLAGISSDDDYVPGISLKGQDEQEQGVRQSLFNDCLFYTETLAKIYAEQGYFDRAEEVYTKLSLLYPEKNAYFAGLIEKMKS